MNTYIERVGNDVLNLPANSDVNNKFLFLDLPDTAKILYYGFRFYNLTSSSISINLDIRYNSTWYSAFTNKSIPANSFYLYTPSLVESNYLLTTAYSGYGARYWTSTQYPSLSSKVDFGFRYYDTEEGSPMTLQELENYFTENIDGIDFDLRSELIRVIIDYKND